MSDKDALALQLVRKEFEIKDLQRQIKMLLEYCDRTNSLMSKERVEHYQKEIILEARIEELEKQIKTEGE